jgi:hypothetical protein
VCSKLPGSFFGVCIAELLSNLICISWLFASTRIQVVTLKFCGSSVQTARWLGYACSTKLYDLFSTEVLGHTRARFCISFRFDLCKHAFGGNQLPRARRSELGVLHRKDLDFETDSTNSGLCSSIIEFFSPAHRNNMHGSGSTNQRICFAHDAVNVMVHGVGKGIGGVALVCVQNPWWP